MADGDLSQRAGGGSELRQAGRDLIEAPGVVSVTNIDNAHYYMESTRPDVVAREYMAGAVTLATQRVADFDEAIVKRLDAMERLVALADPGYQKTLSGARVASAATDRALDAERLVELMAERAQDPGRLIRATIERTMGIIDDVDEEHLKYLIWYHYGETRIKIFPRAVELLKSWDERLIEVGFDGTRPSSEWLEHLHVVGAVRLDSSGARHLRPIVEWMTTSDLPMFMPGLSTEELDTKARGYASMGVSKLPYMEHDLRPGYFRLLTKDRESLRQMAETMNGPGVVISDDFMDRVLEDFRVNAHDNTATEAFGGLLQAFPALAQFDEWRKEMVAPVYITHIGKALVWAALRQRDLDVPALAGFLVAD